MGKFNRIVVRWCVCCAVLFNLEDVWLLINVWVGGWLRFVALSFSFLHLLLLLLLLLLFLKYGLGFGEFGRCGECGWVIILSCVCVS